MDGLGVCAHRANFRASQVTKRVCQLAADFRRDGCIVDAITLGKLVFRHPEGSKQDVPDRKCSSEVGIATLLERGVVPAMEDRRCEHIFERSKRPAEVGVDECGMEG